MNTSFISAALRNMDEQLVVACALWAALRLCEHETPPFEIISGLEEAVLSFSDAATASAQSMRAAHSEACPSGVRSAIYATNLHNNFRLHAEHSLVELARQQGLHFVHAMLSDIFETNTSPLELAA